MIDIAKKKAPAPVMGVAVYISYCAALGFSMRGNIAYIGYQYGMPGWFTNDAWAFFLGGLVPVLLYEFITSFTYRALLLKTGGDLFSIRYGLDFAVIAANLTLFGLKFMYIALPLYAAIIEIIINPVVTIIFVGLYMWYAFRMEYVDKSKYRLVLSQVMGTFVSVYLIFALLSMVLSAAA